MAVNIDSSSQFVGYTNEIGVRRDYSVNIDIRPGLVGRQSLRVRGYTVAPESENRQYKRSDIVVPFTTYVRGGATFVRVVGSAALVGIIRLEIYRDTPMTQPVSFAGADVDPAVVETALDNLERQIQEVEAEIRLDVEEGRLGANAPAVTRELVSARVTESEFQFAQSPNSTEVPRPRRHKRTSKMLF